MPEVTVAVTVLSASTTLSAAVGTLSVALVAPSANDTETGGVPETIDPLSVTLTETVSACAAAVPRVTVNVAAVPSVTGVVPASTVATGRLFTVTETESWWERPALSVTLRLKISVASAVSPVSAVKVGAAAAASDSVTLVPPVCVQA